MTSRKNISRRLKQFIIFLLLFILNILFNIFITYSNISNILMSGNAASGENVPSPYMRYGLFIAFGISIVIPILILLILKGMYNEISNGDMQMQNHKSELLSMPSDSDIPDNNYLHYENPYQEFFQNICHDIKTPVGVILGSVQIIETRHLAELKKHSDVIRHLNIIKHNCYRITKLVNSILDTASINLGDLHVNMSNLNIVSFIEEIIRSVVPYAEVKDINMEFDAMTEEIITAADKDKLERVMLNLLSNAIKFTDKGGKVTVNIGACDDKVFISVKDTGPGIPKDKQKIIFQRFKQGENMPQSYAYSGKGMGLSIAKSYIELHGGNIHVKSEKNKGSEFVLELPLKRLNSDHNIIQNNRYMDSKIIEDVKIEFSDIYSS